MNVVINARTNGEGLWSEAKELITVVELTSDYISEEKTHMSLQARFLTDNWKVEEKGLIYTDPLWIEEFRSGLVELYGFSSEAAKQIHYSEQGAQEDDYVDMDCGKEFVTEWLKRTRGE